MTSCLLSWNSAILTWDGFKCYLTYRYFLRWTESRRVVRAMKKHNSQMVWFRYLYVMFSRYMVINTLRRISLVDIELELEVDD